MASQGTMFDENSNASATPISAGQMPAVAAAATPNTAIVSQLLNVKDSRWLQVEVCREFQRGQCTRSDQECKFAHPPPHVDVQQGRVTACYDSIKGRCTRENPKCKYLHPPQHIKDQLLINGRNNLALKNLISAQLNSGGGQPMVNPLQSLQHIQLQRQLGQAAVKMLISQQQAGLAAANMIPTLPYHYYQGMMYPAMLQAADPYQAAVTQQLQAAALLQSSALLSQPGMLAAQQLAALSAASQSPSISGAPATYSYPQGSRKRTLAIANGGAEEEDHGQMLQMTAAAATAAAGVPCKRPAVDKNGAVIYGTAPQGTQSFNPYLLQGLQGYVPAVSFGSGQVPPRY